MSRKENTWSGSNWQSLKGYWLKEVMRIILTKDQETSGIDQIYQVGMVPDSLVQSDVLARNSNNSNYAL